MILYSQTLTKYLNWLSNFWKVHKNLWRKSRFPCKIYKNPNLIPFSFAPEYFRRDYRLLQCLYSLVTGRCQSWVLQKLFVQSGDNNSLPTWWWIIKYNILHKFWPEGIKFAEFHGDFWSQVVIHLHQLDNAVTILLPNNFELIKFTSVITFNRYSNQVKVERIAVIKFWKFVLRIKYFYVYDDLWWLFFAKFFCYGLKILAIYWFWQNFKALQTLIWKVLI